ncbi:GDSL esterase/lipase At2g03980 isoform X4 [Arachis ipaensis]|uniref:GDSL esterase/lipase At2g03980 isoform X4 n=1 Tax=Arachis ipaensis TaxID=130454 RepID=UPI0007AF4ED4|nr:GDSL esterase/lipase At2g03980 isoform X4 [Arachis ipaensis]
MSTNNHLNHSLILTVLLLIAFATKSEQSKQIPALYVFGDSLVDSGNNHYVPGEDLQNFFPYGIDFGTPTGRCTNGKTVADFLAIYLGLPFAPAYLGLSSKGKRVITTGINYASAGSGILPDTNNKTSFIMDEQIRGFERTVKGILPKGLGEEAVEKHVSESLFLVSSGVNDHFKNRTFRGSRKFASYLINEFKIRLQG